MSISINHTDSYSNIHASVTHMEHTFNNPLSNDEIMRISGILGKQGFNVKITAFKLQAIRGVR